MVQATMATQCNMTTGCSIFFTNSSRRAQSTVSSVDVYWYCYFKLNTLLNVQKKWSWILLLNNDSLKFKIFFKKMNFTHYSQFSNLFNLLLFNFCFLTFSLWLNWILSRTGYGGVNLLISFRNLFPSSNEVCL